MNKQMNRFNRLVAWGIIGSWTLTFCATYLGVAPAKSTYELAGLALMVFSIWAAVILFRTAPKYVVEK